MSQFPASGHSQDAFQPLQGIQRNASALTTGIPPRLVQRRPLNRRSADVATHPPERTEPRPTSLQATYSASNNLLNDGAAARQHPLRYAGAGRFWKPVDPNAKRGFFRWKPPTVISTSPSSLGSLPPIETEQPLPALYPLSPPPYSWSERSPTDEANVSAHAEQQSSSSQDVSSSPRPWDQPAPSNEVDISAPDQHRRYARPSSASLTQSLPGRGLPRPEPDSQSSEPLAQRIWKDDRKRKTLLHLQRLAQREEERLDHVRLDEEQSPQQGELKDKISLDTLRLDTIIPHNTFSLEDLINPTPAIQSWQSTKSLGRNEGLPEELTAVELPTLMSRKNSVLPPPQFRHNSDPTPIPKGFKLQIDHRVELPTLVESAHGSLPSTDELDVPILEARIMSYKHARASHLEIVGNRDALDSVRHATVGDDDDDDDQHPANEEESSSLASDKSLAPASVQGDSPTLAQDSLFTELNVLRTGLPDRTSRIRFSSPGKATSLRYSTSNGTQATTSSTISSAPSSSHTSPSLPDAGFYTELSASPSVIHHPRPKPRVQSSVQRDSSDLTKYNTLPAEPFPLSSQQKRQQDAQQASAYDESITNPDAENNCKTPKADVDFKVDIEPNIDPRTGRVYVN